MRISIFWFNVTDYDSIICMWRCYIFLHFTTLEILKIYLVIYSPDFIPLPVHLLTPSHISSPHLSPWGCPHPTTPIGQRKKFGWLYSFVLYFWFKHTYCNNKGWRSSSPGTILGSLSYLSLEHIILESWKLKCFTIWKMVRVTKLLIKFFYYNGYENNLYSAAEIECSLSLS